ncbi:hypothetical protein PSEUDO8BK_10547 [Pseudomonas sp. 8BK]|nr:hypothetical protein PSEUDO8BK_10547 [Pseudomonas sp. 8BK]
MVKGFQAFQQEFIEVVCVTIWTVQFSPSQVAFGDWSVKQAFGLLIAHSKPFLALPAVPNTPKPASQSAWGLQITL